MACCISPISRATEPASSRSLITARCHRLLPTPRVVIKRMHTHHHAAGEGPTHARPGLPVAHNMGASACPVISDRFCLILLVIGDRSCLILLVARCCTGHTSAVSSRSSLLQSKPPATGWVCSAPPLFLTRSKTFENVEEVQTRVECSSPYAALAFI